MFKKSHVFLIISALVISFTMVATVRLYCAAAPDKKSNGKDLYEKLDVFTDAISIIQKSYVEDVHFKDLIYGALKGMLKSLDSHSQFMDPDAYKEIMIETEGEFGGVGIEITIKDKYLTVVTPLEGTPAFKVGIQPGDKIVKIDGQSTEDITLNGAVKKLRGKPNTKVVLTIARPSRKEIMDFPIIRDIIKLDSVKEPKIIKDNIGYVRITQFQENTDEDLEKALAGLEKKGMKSLILDLRNNPGGLLQEAIDITDRFLGGKKLIVYTKGRMPEQTVDFRGQSDAAPFKHPIVVLTNGGSASGSEILAGAIQDYKRGILLGTKTFGKGSVQSVLPLKDGSALKLTTALYYTPKGRMIHGKGIEPDITVPVSEEDDIKLMMAKVKKLDETGAKLEKTVEAKDPQLDRAVDLLEGIKIITNKEELTEDKLKTEEPKKEEKQQNQEKESDED